MLSPAQHATRNRKREAGASIIANRLVDLTNKQKSISKRRRSNGDKLAEFDFMHEKERARREGKGMDVPSRWFGALRGCAVRASEPWHPECEGRCTGL
jgi:hypothetical protein